MENIKNIEALRAKAAFAFAQEGFEEQSKNEGFNYPAAVQELASIIRMNGLRAAMAYFYNKENAHRCIFKQVRRWFASEEPTGLLKSELQQKESEKEQDDNFMKILISRLNDNQYRIVQAETLTLASWMIRFAKAPDTTTSKNQQSAHGNASQP